MKKTKLEVIRINEDVIATSMKPNGEYFACVYLTDLDENIEEDFMSDGFVAYNVGITPDTVSMGLKNAYGPDAEAQTGVWYSYYFSEDNFFAYKCSDIAAHKNHTHSAN